MTITSATVAGIVVAGASVLLLPGPFVARILVVAPLVVVPSLLRLAPQALPRLGPVARLAGWPAFLAALPLVGALWLPAGPAALALVVPWLVLAGILVVAATLDGLPRLPRMGRRDDLHHLLADAALGFLAIGALFLAFDRAGLEAFGFTALVVLLTAVHFHFAGFGLLVVGTTLARRTGAPLSVVAALALAAGMPVTATAFLLDSDGLNLAGAVLVVFGALGVALGLLGLRRPVLLPAGGTLLVGVPFGLAWAAAPVLGSPLPDLDLMIRIHGGLNATGVVLAALLVPASLRWAPSR